ncbi:hypothetical protein PInf_018512 [Phytophthora infestans]|nr:hypothetical protein PInf_018512 [Phytophthora infestans]
MNSDVAFLLELEAFLDSGPISVANIATHGRVDASSLSAFIDSPSLQLDSITATTLSALIANDDQDGSSSSDQDCPKTKATQRAKDAKRRQAYRLRLKDERNTLYSEVKQLSMTIQRLKKAAQDTGKPALAPRYDTMWKNVAVAELEARERAVAKHQRLVVAVTSRDVNDLSVTHFIRSTKMLNPSTFASACQEMWTMAKQHKQADDAQVYSVGKDVKNTLAIWHRVSKHHASGKTASIRPLLVVRRFAADDKMVIVWRVLAQGEGIFQGIRADETGWCRLRPSTNAAEPGTWIELYARRTILHYKDRQLDAETARRFNDVLQSDPGKYQEGKLEGLQRIVQEKKLYGFDTAT